MIITHTANKLGERRVYIGGRSSLECWIEPSGETWQLRIESAFCGNAVSEHDRHTWAAAVLAHVAVSLGLDIGDLSRVPFDDIAALHTADPYDYERSPAPKARVSDDKFVASNPVTRAQRQHQRRI